MAFGKLPGDWELYRDESKMLAAIEPVTEGIMQLFCQTIYHPLHCHWSWRRYQT